MSGLALIMRPNRSDPRFCIFMGVANGRGSEPCDHEIEVHDHFRSEPLRRRVGSPDGDPTRKKRTARKYRFVTSHEPAFPYIKKILLKNQHIILDDDELKKVFPTNTSYWMTMNLRRRYSLMGQKTFKFQREERPKTLKKCLLNLK